MVCYAVSVGGAALCYLWRKKGHTHDPGLRSLNLMLLGGALFGVVDHLWNGELFLIGPNIMGDLTLGFAILFTIVGVWAVTNRLQAASPIVAKVKAV